MSNGKHNADNQGDVVLTSSEVLRPTFGGHEKFVFRNGWLKKGYDAFRVDPSIFNKDEALVVLGVGKNMVRSIRHWCLATGLLQENGYGPTKDITTSRFGDSLFDNHGWDPFLEDTGSLWLIHWRLFSNPVRAFVWPVVFSAFYDSEFSKKQLITLATRAIEQLNVRTTEGTIEREIDCILRTYISANGMKGQPNEENMDCPLTELELIQPIPSENAFRFNVGPKPSLPVSVFGFALIDYLERRLDTRRTVAVEELLYQTGSPGQAFKLDENSLIEYLEKLEFDLSGQVQVNETIGLRQLYLADDFVENMEEAAYRLLGDYYGRH